jgi:hypothetical protein
MSAILALLATGLGKALVAVLAGLVAIASAYLKGRSAGKQAQKSKEADAYAKHLQELSDAAAAGAAVRPDDELRNDGFNRDR